MMDNEYVSRAEALGIIKRAYRIWNSVAETTDDRQALIRCIRMRELSKAVEAIFTGIPAADVEPVQHTRRKVCGTDEYYGEWLQCSICGYTENAGSAKYCGGCGAKMDLAVEKEKT